MLVKWYVATLIIRSKVGDNDFGPWTCDEQIRLIRASDSDMAYEKAVRLGQSEEHSYENMLGETVHWEFVGLEDLEELSVKSIRDEIEVRSRFFKYKNPSDLITSRERLAINLGKHRENVSEYKTLTDREPLSDE